MLVTSSIWERWYLVAPCLVFIAGEYHDVPLKQSFKIFLLSFFGLLVIDLALEGIIFSLKKLVRAWHITFLVAASTNLPEFAIAVTSFLKGDPLDVAPNVALGSNFANVILGFLALFFAIIARLAKSQTDFNVVYGLRQLLNSSNQVIFALFLSCLAILYFKSLQSSGLLSIWVVIVLLVVVIYYYRNFSSHVGRKASLISQISHHELDEILAEVKDNNPLIEFLRFVDDFLHNHSAFELDQIANAVEVKRLQNASFQELNLWKKNIPRKHIRVVSEILEHFEIYSHLSNSARHIYLVAVALGLVGIAIGAFMLDNSADLLAADFNLQKGLVAFFVLSFLTSAGEFLTSYKFFLQGKLRDGWRNIADSNLSNLIITLIILALHFIQVVVL